MPRCAGFKPNGNPCERIVAASQSHCYAHDPNRKEERIRNAARAGRGGGGTNREIRELKNKLSALYEDVIAKRVDPRVGAVANQIINAQLRALALGRELHQTDELAERLKALEAGAARWRA